MSRLKQAEQDKSIPLHIELRINNETIFDGSLNLSQIKMLLDTVAEQNPGKSRPRSEEEEASDTNKKENILIPVTKWNNYHDWPTVGGLRHLIFFEKTNGFSHCIRRIGRRVLIDEKAFFEWVKRTNPQKT
jgi:hypothetical protein